VWPEQEQLFKNMISLFIYFFYYKRFASLSEVTNKDMIE